MVGSQIRIQKMFFALGTVNTLTVFEEGKENALQRAKLRVMELHQKLSAFSSTSEIGQINRCAGLRAVRVSEDTFSLIEDAVLIGRETGGLFDVTIHPLSMLWKEAIRRKDVPRLEKIRRQRALVNCQEIVLDRSQQTVMLPLPGQALDLGAIAKGYAADEVRRVFREEGVSNAVIDLGGTVITSGDSRSIGLRDPSGSSQDAFAALTVQNKAVVTAGVYEQGFIRDGRFYHHIIDPKTGYPADSDLLAVTLFGSNAELLDALSTAALMLGMKKSLPLLLQIAAEAVFITRQGQVYTTPGIQGQLDWL